MIYNIIELNEKLTTDLRILAKEMGIRRPDAYKKEELIYKILDEQAIAETKKKPSAPDKQRDYDKKKVEAPKSSPRKEEEQKQKPAPPKQNQKKQSPPVKADNKQAVNKNEQKTNAQPVAKKEETQKESNDPKAKQDQKVIKKIDKAPQTDNQQKPQHVEVKAEIAKDAPKVVEDKRFTEAKTTCISF